MEEIVRKRQLYIPLSMHKQEEVKVRRVQRNENAASGEDMF